MEDVLKNLRIDKLKDMWKERDPGQVSHDVVQTASEESSLPEAAAGEVPTPDAVPVLKPKVTPKELTKVRQDSQSKLMTSWQNLLDGNPLAEGQSAKTFLEGKGITDLSNQEQYAKAQNLLQNLTKQVKDVAAPGKGKATNVKIPKLGDIELPVEMSQRLKKFGIEGNFGSLLEKVPLAKLPPQLQRAVQAAQSGDLTALKSFISGDATAATPEDATVNFAEIEKFLASNQARGAKLGTLKQQLEAAKGGYVGSVPGKVGKLAQHVENVEQAGDPAAIDKLLSKVKKSRGMRDVFGRNPDARDARLSALQGQAADITRVGADVGTAEAPQLASRMEDLFKALKGGTPGTAAVAAGLEPTAGAGLKSMADLEASPLGKTLIAKAAKDPAMKELLTAFRKSAATELGAGAEAGLLQKLSTYAASKGGTGALAKGVGVQGLIAFAPLLLEMFSGLKGATANKRSIELEKMQQASAPTTESLLARYRAQQFAEQGVNNAAPDPAILKALQSMGPQLTKSEVYIGPDKTMDNVRALMAQMQE